MIHLEVLTKKWVVVKAVKYKENSTKYGLIMINKSKFLSFIQSCIWLILEKYMDMLKFVL